MITRSKALKIKSLPTGDGALVPAGTRITVVASVAGQVTVQNIS